MHKLATWATALMVNSILLPGSTLLLGSACALTSKSEPMQSKYFSVESRATKQVPASAPKGLSLRLGDIESAAHLRERMVFRKANGEVGFHEDRRWTERPEVYLRRAVARALFEEGGVRQVVESGAPTLDLELLDFTELTGNRPGVRLALTVVLSDSVATLWQKTLVVTRKLPPTSPEKLTNAAVLALSECLDEVVGQIRTGIYQTLPQVKLEQENASVQ